MQLLQSKIAAVGKDLCLRMNPHPRHFEQSEVMASTLAMRQTDDPSSRLLDKNLGFQRVSLLLARVATALLFWGRSTGVSVTSTNTTS